MVALHPSAQSWASLVRRQGLVAHPPPPLVLSNVTKDPHTWCCMGSCSVWYTEHQLHKICHHRLAGGVVVRSQEGRRLPYTQQHKLGPPRPWPCALFLLNGPGPGCLPGVAGAGWWSDCSRGFEQPSGGPTTTHLM